MASRRSFLVLLFSVQGMLVLLAALAGEAGRVPGGSGRQLLQLTSLPPVVKVLVFGGSDIHCFNETHLASSGTVYAIEVPGGSPSVTNLQIAALRGDSSQTFQTQGFPGTALLGGDLAFRFENSASLKCWTDGGGLPPSALIQTTCALTVDSVLSPGFEQLFEVVKGVPLPGCSTDTAFQIRSISSVASGSLGGSDNGNCLVARGGTPPVLVGFVPCEPVPTTSFQQFVITNKPFVS